jgi:hypothetical protein
MQELVDKVLTVSKNDFFFFESTRLAGAIAYDEAPVEASHLQALPRCIITPPSPRAKNERARPASPMCASSDCVRRTSTDSWMLTKHGIQVRRSKVCRTRGTREESPRKEVSARSRDPKRTRGCLVLRDIGFRTKQSLTVLLWSSTRNLRVDPAPNSVVAGLSPQSKPGAAQQFGCECTRMVSRVQAKIMPIWSKSSRKNQLGTELR